MMIPDSETNVVILLTNLSIRATGESLCCAPIKLILILTHTLILGDSFAYSAYQTRSRICKRLLVLVEDNLLARLHYVVGLILD